MANIQRKRPPMIAFATDEEQADRLKSLAAKMGVSASVIARSALDKEMKILETAVERGERFVVKRPLGEIVAA